MNHDLAVAFLQGIRTAVYINLIIVAAVYCQAFWAAAKDLWFGDGVESERVLLAAMVHADDRFLEMRRRRATGMMAGLGLLTVGWLISRSELMFQYWWLDQRTVQNTLPVIFILNIFMLTGLSLKLLPVLEAWGNRLGVARGTYWAWAALNALLVLGTTVVAEYTPVGGVVQ